MDVKCLAVRDWRQQTSSIHDAPTVFAIGK
jgi:hypothetical protein